MFPWQAALIHTHSCPRAGSSGLHLTTQNLFLSLSRILFIQENKDPRGAPTVISTMRSILWDFRHSLPPPTTIFSFKWAAQPCIKAEFVAWQSCHPVAGPDVHRPRGPVGTGNALHVRDTHSSWHMRAIGWSSLPGWGHFGTSVSPNYRISASHFLHPSSSLLLLPLVRFLPCNQPPMAESLKLCWEIDILTFLGPSPRTTESGSTRWRFRKTTF